MMVMIQAMQVLRGLSHPTLVSIFPAYSASADFKPQLIRQSICKPLNGQAPARLPCMSPNLFSLITHQKTWLQLKPHGRTSTSH